ncbi:MAG: 30S ribosomal protein S24e [Archaeoglobaceae archaeon]
MEVRIESERYNPLLKRREVHLRIKFNGKTPSRKEIREKIAGLLNTEPERFVVQYIKNEFGKREAKCYVKIYDTVEDLKRVEEDYVLLRNFPELRKEKKETKS